jgi:hypothetical protein
MILAADLDLFYLPFAIADGCNDVYVMEKYLQPSVNYPASSQIDFKASEFQNIERMDTWVTDCAIDLTSRW